MKSVLTKNEIIRAFLYGFIVFIAWMVLLFLASMVFHTEQPASNVQASSAVIIGMGIITWAFGRRFRIGSTNQALLVGAIWVLVLFGATLFIAIPNGTTKTMFGSGYVYVVIPSMLAGAVLSKKRTTPVQ